jgi:predicted metal-binding membrane protein
MMANSSRVFGGTVLIAAGLYEWTPLKDACLSQCQSPLMFIQRHGGFRRDAPGAAMLGLRHGAYCVGCCWMLMALLFVGGVMNVLWIAAISAFVFLEKALPVGRLLARTAGLVLIATGAWLIAT